jgi:acyl carrier protein
MMEARAIVDSVIVILKREFPLMRAMEIGPETPLVSSGLLDSFGIVGLLGVLETDFKIDIDVNTVDVGRFESPAAIASLCDEILKSQGRSA